MAATDALAALLARFAAEPDIASLAARLAATDPDATDALVALYRDALSPIERAMWRHGPPDRPTLSRYQGAFREREVLLRRGGTDRRHRFFVIIPVADRPKHLRNILASLLEQCRTFGYGGFACGARDKVVALVADDSKDAAIVEQNRAIAREFAVAGLATVYFGADRQLQLLRGLDGESRARLTRVLGEPERTGMHHKGASVTRNLAYLLAHRVDRHERTLFHFVDSDEQFKVRVARPGGSEDLLAINYFDALDRLFGDRGVRVVTGKVVGDPPVSPAVMTGNFLDDLISFLQRMASVAPEDRCSFHGDGGVHADGAAYHDMAGLFGFDAAAAYPYRCTLDGEHDHSACLAAFAAKLDHFFEGEHLTRPTYYAYADAVADARPARTVYTGNYVLDAASLRYFIPFATLKLRMAGPTLGRLIQAELGERFVAANVPLLHTRTTEERFEFRAGVAREQDRVDLSGEFERQFFGDVMLFTVRELIGHGFPDTDLSTQTIGATVDEVETRLQALYADTRRDIQARLAHARDLFEAPARWWRHAPHLETARTHMRRFFANVEHNFGPGSRCHALIQAGENRDTRLAAIRDALAHYRADRAAWEALLCTTDPGAGPAL